MTSVKLLFITFSLFVLNKQANAQDDWVSPCPRLFVYEGKNNEPDKWYGIATLLSDTDLSGIWFKVILDKPAIQLGNWFGSVKTKDHKEYLIKNPTLQLKAHVPQTVRFFIQYNPSEPPPKLESFRLNAKTICPEGADSDAPPVELQTSGPFDTISNPVNKPKPTTPEPSSSDDFYQGDFHNLFNRPARPTSKDNEQLNSVCGTVVTQPRPLITYGQATQEGEFPWHAALYHTRGLTQAYICGGSLISKYHVITAAHCVTKSRSSTPLNPENLVVFLGKYQLKRFTNPGIQDRDVAEIITYPRYDGRTYSNDIALLKLASAVDITDYVRPVCIWQDSTDLNAVQNRQGSVAGWGFDENGKLSEELMQAHMPVVSQETCLRSFPEFYSRFTSDHTYCAGFRNGTSVCNGDSGGGMVFPKPGSNSNNPMWQLRGLVSISVALQNQVKCDASNYVVFTDAAKYLDWIKNSMK